MLADLAEPSSKTETSRFSYALPTALLPGTTYYWKVVGKTMALQTRDSNIWSFTTAGTPPPPPPTPAGSGDIVLHAANAQVTGGGWQISAGLHGGQRRQAAEPQRGRGQGHDGQRRLPPATSR